MSNNIPKKIDISSLLQKSSLTPQEKQLILSKYENLIHREARKYSSFLPYEVVLAEAYKIAYDALDKYDPKKNVEFSTFLVSQLHQLNRLSIRYGQSIRLPENIVYELERLNAKIQELETLLGREPTIQELADALGWPINKVENLLKKRYSEVSYSNLPYSLAEPKPSYNWIYYVYHSLSPTDQKIFEWSLGLGGKRLKAIEIAKKLKKSPSWVTKRLKIINNEIEKIFNYPIS